MSHYDKIAPRDAVTFVKFSADRQTLLFTSWPIGGFPAGQKTNYEVEIESGQGIDQYRVDDDLRELTVSPKGDLIATVENRRPIDDPNELGRKRWRWFLRLRDAITKDVTREIELPGSGQECVFSPDGTRIALSISQRSEQNQVSRWIGIWDTASDREVARIGGYVGQPFALAFSPNGNRLASSHVDSTVLIWDLEQFRHDR